MGLQGLTLLSPDRIIVRLGACLTLETPSRGYECIITQLLYYSTIFSFLLSYWSS